jgi:dolichol kinase
MNNNKEIIRKIIHIVFGIAILSGFYFLEWGIFIRLLFILSLVVVLLTLLHLKFRIKAIEYFTKEEEKKFPLKGLLFFVAGSVLVMYIFTKNIALASITILTFGDSVSCLASYFGSRYKLNPFRRYKSLFGSICGFVVAFLFCLIFIDPLSALVGSFFGMLAESLTIKLGESDADDNLIMPLVAAIAMYLLSRII